MHPGRDLDAMAPRRLYTRPYLLFPAEPSCRCLWSRFITGEQGVSHQPCLQLRNDPAATSTRRPNTLVTNPEHVRRRNSSVVALRTYEGDHGRRE